MGVGIIRKHKGIPDTGERPREMEDEGQAEGKWMMRCNATVYLNQQSTVLIGPYGTTRFET
jgi:hypothetical protein